MSKERDNIRAAYFGNKVRSTPVTLASGVIVECRQPTVGDQLAISALQDTAERMLQLFTRHVYVPGTDEQVFDSADFESIKNTPASGDYAKITQALTALMDLEREVKEAAKN
jgi:hypothetical protein